MSTPEHNTIAYNVACQSVVLLKNTREILPLNIEKTKEITVIGETAVTKNAQGGFGAGVKARYEITPLEGLKNRLGDKVKINYLPGYKTAFKPGQRFQPENMPDKKLTDDAVKAAASSEVTILFVGDNREVETESVDRKTMDLPFGQDYLIKAVCAANPKTIIVVVAGAPVNLHVPIHVLLPFYGRGLTDRREGMHWLTLFSVKVNPSGKMPFTVPVKLNDSPAHVIGNFSGNR